MSYQGYVQPDNNDDDDGDDEDNNNNKEIAEAPAVAVLPSQNFAQNFALIVLWALRPATRPN